MDPVDHIEALLAGIGRGRVKRVHVERLSASPAATAEFAAMRWAHHESTGHDLLSELPPPPDGSLLAHARAGLEGPALLGFRDGDNARRALTLGPAYLSDVPCGDGGWSPGDPFLLFQERFKDSLISSGSANSTAYGLAGALGELASNASEHSRSLVAPLACYSGGLEGWEFAVCDVGCGVRTSLGRNPELVSQLSDDLSALRLALRPGVSATGDSARGNGFRTVFKALADRDSVLRIRSGSALALWSGHSPTDQELDFNRCRPLPGFQITVRGTS